ncbi:UTP--glucose-1-phosphate uridylyltransferase [Serratia rubidaea]|uniref:UTP--glucose-1-phosphate uridylyltransferase n=1 Tax=Serratia rubidaea TaxID=61652 RepID=A0A3S4GML7_SERRU|nr:UTP--glucose-1-phosphate uridylyltransferase [Serratia rubidaea]
MQVRQGQAKGLGHAVLCAKPMVGDEPFVVLLPDVLLDDATADLRKENLAKMLQRFEQTGYSQIMVEPVPEKDVSKYGVVDCGGAALAAGESAPMTAVVEKPAVRKRLLTWPSSGAMCCRRTFGRCWRKRLRAPATKSS